MPFYNAKIIEYPNGEVQVRLYDKPMACKIPQSEKEYCKENNLTYNPFTDRYEPLKVVKEFESTDKVASYTDNVYRNSNRSKQAVYEYSRCYEWEYFITLTFNGEKVNRYDYEECSQKVRAWLHNQRKFAPNLKYLVVPEQHKDGAWHFHGLLADVGEMKFLDSGKKDKGDVIYNMIKYQFGFTTATKVKDTHKVAKYIGKYITKAVCDLTKGKHRYFVSNNLPKPVQSTFLLMPNEDVNEFVEMYANSVGLKKAHVSQTQAKDCYTNVTYIELQ